MLCYVMPLTGWKVLDNAQIILRAAAYLMLIKYWAKATDSVLPVMLMVRSRLAGASRSSQFEIRIIAPESCLISATFDPPLPMMQPISSLGTVISWVCWLLAERPWPLSMASAAGLRRLEARGFPFKPLICKPIFPICGCTDVGL